MDACGDSCGSGFHAPAGAIACRGDPVRGPCLACSHPDPEQTGHGEAPLNRDLGGPVVSRTTRCGHTRGGTDHSLTAATPFTHYGSPGGAPVGPKRCGRTAALGGPVIFLEHRSSGPRRERRSGSGRQGAVRQGEGRAPGRDLTVATRAALVRRSLDAARAAENGTGSATRSSGRVRSRHLRWRGPAIQCGTPTRSWRRTKTRWSTALALKRPLGSRTSTSDARTDPCGGWSRSMPGWRSRFSPKRLSRRASTPGQRGSWSWRGPRSARSAAAPSRPDRQVR